MARNWEKLDDVSKSIQSEPWSLYWREMKTGSSEFNKFLLDPLVDFVENFDGVTDGWTVQTNVLNHEVGLTLSTTCNLAIVDPQKKIVYLTLYKHQRTGKRD